MSKMNSLKFLFFAGCPNYELARTILVRLGAEFEEIEQTQLPEGHPYKYFSSPSIIINGSLVFGERLDDSKGGCSLGLPDEGKILKHLM